MKKTSEGHPNIQTTTHFYSINVFYLFSRNFFLISLASYFLTRQTYEKEITGKKVENIDAIKVCGCLVCF